MAAPSRVSARVQPLPLQPPQSIEAEQSVLGGLLLNNELYFDLADKLAPEDFYRVDHQALYRGIGEMISANQACDFVTLSAKFEREKRLDEVNGASYIASLAVDTYSIANVLAYAGIVRERSVLRGLIAAGADIGDLGYRPEGRTVAELLDVAEGRLAKVRHQQGTSNAQSCGALVDAVSRRIEEARKRKPGEYAGLATGFTEYDRRTNGLESGDLVIVAARPGMGKTSWSMNVVEHVAVFNKLPVAVFSMEMTGEQLMMRMHSTVGRVPLAAIRSGQLNDADMSRIVSAQGWLCDAPIHIDCSSGLSPLELRARARRLAAKHGIKLVVVDYLQRMQVPGSKENRTTVITEISNALKDLAMELRVPVIALSQLNRSLEQRENKRPRLSDLRESGGIEQDADIVTFIYREAYYNEDCKEDDRHKAEIDIAKQRSGPTGKLDLAYLGQFCKFDNIADPSFAS